MLTENQIKKVLDVALIKESKAIIDNVNIQELRSAYNITMLISGIEYSFIMDKNFDTPSLIDRFEWSSNYKLFFYKKGLKVNTDQYGEGVVLGWEKLTIKNGKEFYSIGDTPSRTERLAIKIDEKTLYFWPKNDNLVIID